MPRRNDRRIDPTKFTPELGENICELIACGWLMKDAAGHLGIPAETVCRWVVKHETFRETYAVARGQRTEIWAEEIIEIADDAARDYTTDKHGHFIFDSENVHRARLQIELRKWQMARLDPRLRGDRQQIDVRNDWHLLTEQERRRKAEEIIAMIRELKEPPPRPPPLVYRSEEAPDEEPSAAGGADHGLPVLDDRRSARTPRGAIRAKHANQASIAMAKRSRAVVTIVI